MACLTIGDLSFVSGVHARSFRDMRRCSPQATGLPGISTTRIDTESDR
jgi:hypothetical protein